MTKILICVVALVVGCWSQTAPPTGPKQCYQFVDLTENYNMRSLGTDYPLAGIAEEYGRRSELQELLGNIMGAALVNIKRALRPQYTKKRTPLNTGRPRETPKFFIDPNNIPIAYGGTGYQRRLNPYQKSNPYHHRVNVRNPGYQARQGPYNPYITGPYNGQAPKPHPSIHRNYLDILRQGGVGSTSQLPNNPRVNPRVGRVMNQPIRRPVSNQKLTFEELRRLVTPHRIASQRYAGYNPYNRSPRYKYGRRHVVRKRSNRYTYEQLLNLVNPFNKPYPVYPGTNAYNNRQHSYSGYRYPSHNSYNPYPNNFNPYTARRYTTLRGRYQGGTIYPTSRRYPYGNPHYRRKRATRITPSSVQVEPVSVICPAKTNDIQLFSAYGGDCWILEPSKQMIKYASCGHDECNSCSNAFGVSKCVENYHWVSMWAYCAALPENRRIREIELYLPQSCSCKSYEC